MIVLSWLIGNPRRCKTYVGNHVSSIMDRIPPDKWSHVVSAENPADCASRALLPSELLHNELWWKGPPRLVLTQPCWPKQPSVSVEQQTEEIERSVWSPLYGLNSPSSHGDATRVSLTSSVLQHGCYVSSTIVGQPKVPSSNPLLMQDIHPLLSLN